MPHNKTLGVVIITKNEEKNIGRCLASVKWADEIIVVDSGSTDKTIEIAKFYQAKIYSQPWLGFGLQKNKAINYCSCDWILSLDADEEVSKTLKDSIQRVIKDNSNSPCKFKRLSQFCGQWIHHGDWGRDVITRLFKRGTACFSDDIVHEKLISKERVKIIPGILYHYSQSNIAASLYKMNDYSNNTASILFAKGKKTNLLTACFHKHWTFFRSFVMRCGFLDGARGYLIAKLSAYGAYFKYVKLWEKWRNEK